MHIKKNTLKFVESRNYSVFCIVKVELKIKRVLPLCSVYMKRFLCSCCFLLAISVSHAQSRIYVNEYLNIGVGARGLSMAGAQSASTQDVYAGFWNPAGLLGVESDYQVGLMHAEYFAGIFKYDYAAAAMPLKDKKRSLGVSFIRFATDNIPYTLDYVRPDGSFDESKLKGFSAADYAVFLSYAQELNL